jgi:hypothetical protein
MKTFTIHGEFEAESIDDAFERLFAHFGELSELMSPLELKQCKRLEGPREIKIEQK